MEKEKNTGLQQYPFFRVFFFENAVFFSAVTGRDYVGEGNSTPLLKITYRHKFKAKWILSGH